MDGYVELTRTELRLFRREPFSIAFVIALPLGQLVAAMQDPWFGHGWSFDQLAILLGYAVVAGVPALWFFRWE